MEPYYNPLDDNGQHSRWLGYVVDLPFQGCIPAPVVTKYEENVFGVRVDKQMFIRRPCHKCKEFKALEAFYEGHSPCKDCHQVAVKNWQAKNKHKVKAYKAKANAAWRKRAKESDRSKEIAAND